MAITIYLDDITVSPREWYEGLEVKIEARVGNFNAPCGECEARLFVGLSSSSTCDCGSIPNDYNPFDHIDIDQGDITCGGERTFTFYHTVTRDDIDLINDGVYRCFALLSGGMRPTMCYEKSSVSVAEEPAEGKIKWYDAPAELESGVVADIYVDVENIGSSDGDFTLKLIDTDSETVIDTDTIGILAAGSSAFGRHLTGTMPSKNWNLMLELWRAE